MAYGWNWTDLCRNDTFVFWDGQDFGDCFLWIAIECPVFILLLLTSVFYLGRGNHIRHLSRSRPAGGPVASERILFVRSVVSVLIATCPLIWVTLSFVLYDGLPIGAIVTCAIKTSAWLFHAAFVYFALARISMGCRGPFVAMFTWLLTAVVSALLVRSAITSDIHASPLHNGLAYSEAVLQTFYLLTLVPSGRVSSSPCNNSLNVNDNDSDRQFLVVGGEQDYGTIHRPNSPQSDCVGLGVAAQGACWPSKLTFYWLKSVMSLGASGKIRTLSDVFSLPDHLRTSTMGAKFWLIVRDLQLQSAKGSSASREVSLIRALMKFCGLPYFSLGVLKIISDCLSFAAPLLLHQLVQFVESGDVDSWDGYYYAMGLCGSILVNAFLSTHFYYQVFLVGFKLRAAVTTSVFRKPLSLNAAEMKSFNVADVVNYIGTDTERLANLGPTLHALWSLPFQFVVCIVLLYRFLGVAVMAGVAFAVVVLPVNRWIALRIRKYTDAMMVKKDDRVKVIYELLHGIRVVKLYAWESHFVNKILRIRDEEVKNLKGLKYMDALCVYLWATTPVVMSVLTFTVYVLLGNDLTPAKVFTSFSLFGMLIYPLNAFPWVINALAEASVSFQRIQKLINAPESNLAQFYTHLEEEQPVSLYVKNGDFAWGTSEKEDAFKLHALNLSASKGLLVGVMGAVGSGKTSVLLSLLAEMPCESGEVGTSCVADGMAYVAQEPWLQRDTIRNNVLFGRNLKSQRYSDVLDMCQLNEDLDEFPAGDLTEVGERGATLSGGQRARVALARAVYQDSEIYLLDDPLAALDNSVATAVFQKCVLGGLKGKTRIMCTHNRRFLAKCDHVIFLNNGSIIHQGKPEEVLAKLGEAAALSKENTDTAEEKLADAELEVLNSGDDGGLVKEEERSFGSLRCRVIWGYVVAAGPALCCVVILSLALMQTTKVASDWWVGHMSTGNNTADQRYFFTVYGCLVGGNSLAALVRAFLYAYCCIKAAVCLHSGLLSSVVKAPVMFFDSNPVGRILNRFTSDIFNIDEAFPFTLNILLAQAVGLIGAVVVIAISLPWILLLLVPLSAIYCQTQYYYRHTSREVRRLYNVTLSPIYALVNETITGLITVRAFRAEARFKARFEELMEKNQRLRFLMTSIGQWLTLCLQLIGVAVVGGVALMAVVEHHSRGIDPAVVGLALSYSLTITSLLNVLVQMCTETEKEAISIERCQQYIEDVTPEHWEGQVDPPPSWPSCGVVKFNNVSMRYRQHIPNALEEVSFETRPGEKVGIVGRTGSGKTSLLSVLFRLFEIQTGEITVDKVPVKCLDLQKLRSRLAVVPQEPVVFAGSLRDNLDPFGKHSDSKLWNVLHQCHLAAAAERLGGLDSEVGGKSGLSLSVGEKQLLCLCRALLIEAKVLCIDEVMAHIDVGTSNLMEKTIAKAFAGSTIFYIAHRLDSVLRCDRVLVMSQGRVVEFAPPQQLLQDPQSEFSRLSRSER